MIINFFNSFHIGENKTFAIIPFLGGRQNKKKDVFIVKKDFLNKEKRIIEKKNKTP
jgi:hypothetical protein